MKKILLLTSNQSLSNLLAERRIFIIVNNTNNNNYKKKIQESNLIIIDDSFSNNTKDTNKIYLEEIINYLNKIDNEVPIINLGSSQIKGSNTIKKPFHVPTFMDLLDNLLSVNLQEEKIFETNHHIINSNGRFIQSKETDNKIKITEREVEVLSYLYNANKIVNKQELLRKIWKYSNDTDTRAVENIIYKLRKSMKDNNMQELVRSTKKGYSIIKD